MSALLLCAGLAIPVGTIAFTITSTGIFERQRDWLKIVWPWGGALVSCPYCLSHWIACVVLWAVGVRGVLLLVLGTFTVVAFSTLWLLVLTRAYQSRDLRLVRQMQRMLGRLERASDKVDHEAA